MQKSVDNAKQTLYNGVKRYNKGDENMRFDTKNIQAEMGRKNITRQELAKRINLSSNSLSKKMNGITQFKVDELELIAKVLDVPVIIFFN